MNILEIASYHVIPTVNCELYNPTKPGLSRCRDLSDEWELIVSFWSTEHVAERDFFFCEVKQLVSTECFGLKRYDRWCYLHSAASPLIKGDHLDPFFLSLLLRSKQSVELRVLCYTLSPTPRSSWHQGHIGATVFKTILQQQTLMAVTCRLLSSRYNLIVWQATINTSIYPLLAI